MVFIPREKPKCSRLSSWVGSFFTLGFWAKDRITQREIKADIKSLFKMEAFKNENENRAKLVFLW
jgi:hypothetical protein